MSTRLIIHATVVTLGDDNRIIPDGAVWIENGTIAEIGSTGALTAKYADTDRLDAEGKILMPGFICAHHHLYSTMARGFAPPGEPASNFGEILERLWWRLDKALSPDDVLYSALVPLIDCIRHGTTTIFDHHASPSCRDGSLDILADAVLRSGIRASLCYEVSDRNEPGAGVRENARFLERVQRHAAGRLAGMVGIHASFTVSDETLAMCREVAEEYDVGYHIHVAEGVEDHQHALEHFGVRTVERLVDRGICGEKSLYIHCVNVDDHELELIRETGTAVVHNPESNMNNAVGVAPVLEMMRRGILVGLGTDGMASDMPAQMRVAYLLHRLDQRDPRVGFLEAPRMLLENNARLAERFFGRTFGRIEVGAAADLILLDYAPPTPLTPETFLGHLIFGIPGAAVDTTIVDGEVLMRYGVLTTFDEERVMARSRELAQALWKRI